MQLIMTVDDKRTMELLFGHRGQMSTWMHSLNGDLKEGALVHFDMESDDEGAGTGKRRYTYTDFQRGLAIMAEKHTRHFADFMAENDDDVTFDVAWQCIIFGKVIYG